MMTRSISILAMHFRWSFCENRRVSRSPNPVVTVLNSTVDFENAMSVKGWLACWKFHLILEFLENLIQTITLSNETPLGKKARVLDAG